MLKAVLLALAGAASGVLGGMGMGGGTVLIPALTIFFSVGQKTAQAINLAAFAPMAAVSLFVHIKNGRVRKEGLLWIIIPACACSVGGSLLAAKANAEILGRIFGVFLLILSVFQFFSPEITEFIEKKQKKKAEKPDSATNCTKT